MRSGMVAVWDTDPDYAEKLSEYLRKQGGLGSSVVFFGDRQHLRRAVEQRQVAVAVAGSEIEAEPWLQGIPAVYLSEVGQPKGEKDLPGREQRWQAMEREEEAAINRLSRASPSGFSPVRLYKYQPASHILQALSGIRVQAAQQLAAAQPEALTGVQPAWIRGIYSPMGGCLKTSLGLVMGCLRAEECRCLFLSLEAHSGFRTLFGRQYPVDLADLFALVRQGGDLLGTFSEALQPFGKLQYIPPVIWPVDIREAEFSELKELLRRLALCGRFDEIIVDVGQDLARPEKILMLCDEIYQPEKEDVFSQAKLAEYDSYLQVSGYEALRQRTRRIPLSRLTAGLEMTPWDQWQRWEEMIPVVRQILKEVSHEGKMG